MSGGDEADDTEYPMTALSPQKSLTRTQWLAEANRLLPEMKWYGHLQHLRAFIHGDGDGTLQITPPRFVGGSWCVCAIDHRIAEIVSEDLDEAVREAARQIADHLTKSAAAWRTVEMGTALDLQELARLEAAIKAQESKRERATSRPGEARSIDEAVGGLRSMAQTVRERLARLQR